MLGSSVTALSIEDGTSKNFIQNNTFGETKGGANYATSGVNNVFCTNTCSTTAKKPVTLLDSANGSPTVPAVTSADDASVSGTACCKASTILASGRASPVHFWTAYTSFRKDRLR